MQKKTMSLAVLSSFIGIMPVLATQGEGHTVSQNPKAPLTGEQLNALPPEVQANVQRMMNAAPIEKRTKSDGTESTVYHTPSYKHEKAQEFANRQGNQNAAAPGTPLAEEVLNNEEVTKKLNMRLAKQGNRVVLESLDALKKAAYEYKDIKKPLTYVFTDAADFITRYDVYQPFLTNCKTIQLSFRQKYLTGAHLKEVLNPFSSKFVQNKPKKWKDYSQVVLSMDLPFLINLADNNMNMELIAAMAHFRNFIVAGHSPEGAQVCKAFKIEEKNCPIWGFFMP